MNTLAQLFEDNTINMEKLDTQTVAMLASTLTLAANLPAGSELITVIGNGTERDNVEALHSWINKQKNLEYASNPRDLVEQLLQRLENDIHEFMTFLAH